MVTDSLWGPLHLAGGAKAHINTHGPKGAIVEKYNSVMEN